MKPAARLWRQQLGAERGDVSDLRAARASPKRVKSASLTELRRKIGNFSSRFISSLLQLTRAASHHKISQVLPAQCSVAWQQPEPASAVRPAAPLALAQHRAITHRKFGRAPAFASSRGFCPSGAAAKSLLEASPYLDVLRSHFLGLGFPPRLAYRLKIKG